jgi:hypothetical protein
MFCVIPVTSIDLFILQCPPSNDIRLIHVIAPSTKSLMLGEDGDNVGVPSENNKALFMFFTADAVPVVDFSKTRINEDVVDNPTSKGPVRCPICSLSLFKNIPNFQNWQLFPPNSYGESVRPKHLYIGAPSTRLCGCGFENLDYRLKSSRKHASMHIDSACEQPKLKVHISKVLSESYLTQNKDEVKVVLTNVLSGK